MTSCAFLYLLWLAVLFLVEVRPSPIWRCPDVKLLPCKTLPKHCTSFRMIYIRHVHLECPACLICADPWEVKPWAVKKDLPSTKSRNKRTKVKNDVVETTPTEEIVKPQSALTTLTKEEKRRLRKQRRERKEKRRKRKMERRLRRQRRRLHRKSNTTKAT